MIWITGKDIGDHTETETDNSKQKRQNFSLAHSALLLRSITRDDSETEQE